MAYSRTDADLHRFTDAAEARRTSRCTAGWTTPSVSLAAFDQPDLKAVTTATVTAPSARGP